MRCRSRGGRCWRGRRSGFSLSASVGSSFRLNNSSNTIAIAALYRLPQAATLKPAALEATASSNCDCDGGGGGFSAGSGDGDSTNGTAAL